MIMYRIKYILRWTVNTWPLKELKFTENLEHYIIPLTFYVAQQNAGLYLETFL